jgi:hypothetical protein
VVLERKVDSVLDKNLPVAYSIAIDDILLVVYKILVHCM